MALSPGDKLGPYEIVARIGAGGMGEVWRARDTRLGRDVAIKILTRTGSSDADRIRRFEVEMKAVGRLSHPNVLAVFDVGSHDGVPYLVSELLEGETLRDRLDRGPLAVKAVATTAVEIAQGLAAAHAAGVIHRDLKPENVFLTRDGRVKLLDFGLAKLVESQEPLTFEGLDEAETAARLTVSGIVVGTVRYMSPEQIRGAPIDHRSDIFAFGALLFEMLTGQMAFRRPSAIESLSATLAEDPLGRLEDPSPIPEEIEPILKRCLEKKPDDRFQSAADLAFQLREYAESFTRASSARRRPIPGARARLVRAAVAAVLALVAARCRGARLARGARLGGAGRPVLPAAHLPARPRPLGALLPRRQDDRLRGGLGRGGRSGSSRCGRRAPSRARSTCRPETSSPSRRRASSRSPSTGSSSTASRREGPSRASRSSAARRGRS